MALEQLRSSSPAALRASWDLDRYFDRTFLISLKSRRVLHQSPVRCLHRGLSYVFELTVHCSTASAGENEEGDW